MERLKKLVTNKEKYIFILILVIQIALFIFSASKREWYYMDELLSYGLMQYKEPFLYKNEDFSDTIHDPDYYKDYITLSKDNIWNFESVYDNQVQDVHPPFYYLLLRLFNMFVVGKFSIWPGIVLNLFLYVISSILLYLIGNQIFKNKKYSLLLCLINGFSIAILEIVLFVRMYQLLLVFCLGILYWNLKNKDKEKINIKSYIVLFFITLFGFMTHYYFLIFLGIEFLVYIYDCIKNKKINKSLYYTLTLTFSGLCGLLIFPACIKHIFSTNRGEEAISNLGISIVSRLNHILRYLEVINQNIFNGHFYIFFILIVISLMIVLILKKYKNIVLKNSEIKYIIFPVIFYSLIIIYVSRFVVIRYLTPIVPLIYCLIIFFYKDVLAKICNVKILCIIFIIICIIFSVPFIKKLNNNSLTFSGVYRFEEYYKNNISDLPVICLIPEKNIEDNKVMSVYFILENAKKSYITSAEGIDIEKLKNAMEKVDSSNGFVLLIYTTYDVEEYINKIKEMDKYSSFDYMFSYSPFSCILIK